MRRWLAGITGAMSMVGACSRFDEAADDTDAGVVADGGSSDEARPSADGGGCVASPCEGFEDESWRMKWSPANVTVSAGAAHAGGFALEATLQAGGSPARLSSDLGAVKKVRLVAWILMPQGGTGEVDLMGIADSMTDGAVGVFYAHSNAGPFRVEVPGRSPVDQAPPSASIWTRVVLQIDLTTHKFHYEVGSFVNDGDLPTTWNPSRLLVSLGAFYAKQVTMPWRVRFDDVELTSGN